MRSATSKRMESRLRAVKSPPPPEDLLRCIRSEVPKTLTVAPEHERRPREGARKSQRLQWAAASLFLLVATGLIVGKLVVRDIPLAADIDNETSSKRDRSLQITRLDSRPGEEPARELDPVSPSAPSLSPDSASRNTSVEVSMSAAVEEVITVTSESPLLDERRLSAGTTVSKVELEKIPAARDPWPILTQTGESAAFRSEAIAPYPAQPQPKPVPGPGPRAAEGRSVPNDQAYGDMYFRSYGVNPFVDTEDDRFSTFGLDVDTGSYTLARSYLQRGHLPPPEAIRVEEFVNYFDYRSEPATEGDFGMSAEGGPSPFAHGPRYSLVRFGLFARSLATGERKPSVLTFVIDVSGSMAEGGRLGLVKQSLRLFLKELRDDDLVGVVVFGSSARLLAAPTSDREAIRRAIDALAASGSTHAEDGLVLGFETARRHFRPRALNRVILCSDGVANRGRTGHVSILERVGDEAARGIELTTIGFGMGNYNDVLMEQLADRGNGRYAYVDSLDEARRLFVDRLTGTLVTVATEARVQVDFNPETVSRYRLLGYENRDVADGRFRDDTVDAGEIGAGHQVSALYEIKTHPGAPVSSHLATLTLRYRSSAKEEFVEQSIRLTSEDIAEERDSASRDLRLASVVAEFAGVLRGSYWARQVDLEDLLERAQVTSAEYPGNVEVAELAALVGKAARLQRQSN